LSGAVVAFAEQSMSFEISFVYFVNVVTLFLLSHSTLLWTYYLQICWDDIPHHCLFDLWRSIMLQVSLFFWVLPFSIFLPRLFLRKLLLWQLNVINSECVRVEIFCSSGCAHVLLVFACCFCLWWMTARGILYFSVILDSTFVKVFVTSWLIDWQWWPWRLMRGWYIELYGLVWYGRWMDLAWWRAMLLTYYFYYYYNREEDCR
jgi:hypothetical protein